MFFKFFFFRLFFDSFVQLGLDTPLGLGWIWVLFECWLNLSYLAVFNTIRGTCFLIDSTLYAFSLPIIFYTFVCFIFVTLGHSFCWVYSDQGEDNGKEF